MQRLGHVSREVCDKLDCVGASLVLAMADFTGLGLSNAILQDLGLVGEGADDTTLQSVVSVGIHLKMG